MVVACGSGGTFAGLAVGLHLAGGARKLRLGGTSFGRRGVRGGRGFFELPSILVKNSFLVLPVGFEGNLSLLDIFVVFSRGLK